MATTQNTYTGNGSLTEYSFTFPYLEESDVRVSLDGVDQATSEYSFANATTISFNTAPANGVAIRIYRQTAQEAPPATFFAGSAIRASDLNENFLQTLYVAQETDQIARNLTTGDIAPGGVTNSLLADDAVTTVKIADLNVTTAKINDSAVTSAKIADGTIVNADVNASAAIAGTKVSPDFGSQNITTTGDATIGSLNGGQLAGTRNFVINGGFQVDQRNSGTAVTPATTTGTYTVDRFRVFQGVASTLTVQQQTAVVPAGFTHALEIELAAVRTPTAAQQFFFGTTFEANNVGRLGFGAAGAVATILSFWVRASVTGTYSVSWTNDANDRSYIGTYTINAANTWEPKTVTFTGDTTGTWTNSGTGRHSFLQWDLGSGSDFDGTADTWQAGNLRKTAASVDFVNGTVGDTFYLAGVQLETGTVATPFEHRSYGDELARCQRYYAKTYNNDVVPGAISGAGILVGITTSANFGYRNFVFPVDMHPTPTVTLFNSATGAQGTWRDGGGTDRTVTAVAVGTTSCSIYTTTAAASSSFYGHAVASSEL